MKQEFVTSLGKVEKGGDVIFLKKLDYRFHNTLFYELFIPVGWIIATLLRALTAETNFEYMQAIVSAGLAIAHGYPLYDVLFKRSLANRIPVNRIKSYDIQQSNSSLETYVILHLQSGRYKKIRFRTLEKQHEGFLETISPYLAATQSA